MARPTTAPATIALAANATAAGGGDDREGGTSASGPRGDVATSALHGHVVERGGRGYTPLTAQGDRQPHRHGHVLTRCGDGDGGGALAIGRRGPSTAPRERETTVLVNGTITAPANSGVTVNGCRATVGTDNQFSANDVPLSAGPTRSRSP
ncbi:MAG: hypothetical protein IPH30_10435 [Betaproteobacteria bacterium]|nr:hypothetical protein [Betaproteobacteria bacterium]